MTVFHALGLALQFLTRLPVPQGVRYSPAALGWSVVLYPLVGLMIGALLVLLSKLPWEAGPMLISSLLLTTWVAITGGLHLDGLADCADAWVGGQGDRERSLGIMKDPCSGPIAVTALVLLLLVKFAALTELAGQSATIPLWFAPLLGRSFVPFLLLNTPYVRPAGLGSPLAENLPFLPAMLAVAFSLLAALIALGPWPVLAVALTALWLRAAMMQRLGGCTGDTLGAGIEITEAVTLLACALARD
ncbi:MAG: adenosylcobinamide-GDP ribazoletransferase [Methylococcaceae bacterium]|nr:adenosylcobinamide-GDP ribazoletransferase [Methylococcaceae bacterium]